MIDKFLFLFIGNSNDIVTLIKFSENFHEYGINHNISPKIFFNEHKTQGLLSCCINK